MSATGFQRRRRTLAALEAEKKENPSKEIKKNNSSLAAMTKKAIIGLAKSKGFYDKSFDNLSKEALIPVFIEAVKAKIADEGIRTAEEAKAIGENDIVAILNVNAVDDELNIVTGAGDTITGE